MLKIRIFFSFFTLELQIAMALKYKTMQSRSIVACDSFQITKQ